MLFLVQVNLIGFELLHRQSLGVINAAIRWDPSPASYLENTARARWMHGRAGSPAVGNCIASVVEDKYPDPTAPLHPEEDSFSSIQSHSRVFLSASLWPPMISLTFL